MSEKGTEAVARLLLALTAFFGCGFVALGAYVWRTHRQAVQLRAELAQRQELKKTLAQQLTSDQCLFPHAKNAVCYAFHPFIGQATLWGAPGHPYQVNVMGLRGPNIQPPGPGRKRIVLLGDSYFFGWKLREEEKLEHHLQALLQDQPVDVVTVAMPGWNVRSEASFLRSVMRTLRPEAVVWEVCQNDVWDTGGVVPLASLSWEFSPQTRDLDDNAFNSMNHPLAVLPAIRARHEENLALVDAVQRDFGVKVLVVPIEIPAGVWGLLTAGAHVNLSSWFVPDKFKWDRRALISADDSHPTDWANERLAVGFAARLADLGVLAPLHFSPEQEDELRTWREVNAAGPAPGALDHDVAEWAPLLPEAMTSEPDFRQVVAGHLGEGRMGRHGLIHLRVPPGRSHIAMELDPVPYAPHFRRLLTVDVRTFEDRRRTVVRALQEDETHVRLHLPLPEGRSRFPIYELEWRFNYDDCDYPNRCFSAFLRSVSSD